MVEHNVHPAVPLSKSDPQRHKIHKSCAWKIWKTSETSSAGVQRVSRSSCLTWKQILGFGRCSGGLRHRTWQPCLLEGSPRQDFQLRGANDLCKCGSGEILIKSIWISLLTCLKRCTVIGNAGTAACDWRIQLYEKARQEYCEWQKSCTHDM